MYNKEGAENGKINEEEGGGTRHKKISVITFTKKTYRRQTVRRRAGKEWLVMSKSGGGLPHGRHYYG